jgi:hypothetical protein
VTHRGSLIYYLTAWILGCFFMSALVWGKDLGGSTESLFRIRSAFGLLFFCFYGFILGAVTAFLGAFLLRRIMKALKSKTPWQWAVAGALLTPALVAAIGTLGGHWNDPSMPRWTLMAISTYGAQMILEAGWWLAIPAGAATGYFLGRVERAFDPAEHADRATNQTSA